MTTQFLVEFGGDERTGTGERFMVFGPWPPPEEWEWGGKQYRRVSYSQLPDDVPNVIRAAKYLDAASGGAE